MPQEETKPMKIQDLLLVKLFRVVQKCYTKLKDEILQILYQLITKTKFMVTHTALDSLPRSC